MVTVTRHAHKRWLQRSKASHMDPADAWDQGTPVEETGLEGDEVRFHRDSRTLLVRKRNSIVTVINADTAHRETREALAAIGGESA